MKSVLISIQPYYVFLIIAQKMGWDITKEKTVEVRKDYPKDKAWNRTTHIYCSKNRKSFNRIPKEYQSLMEKYLGKVIGEFMCDFIDENYPIINQITKQFFYLDEWVKGKVNRSNTCLTVEQLNAYGKGKTLYGWHITDLKIYDKPKELGEFEYRQYPRRGGMGWWLRAVLCPPHSWRYVEE